MHCCQTMPRGLRTVVASCRAALPRRGDEHGLKLRRDLARWPCTTCVFGARPRKKRRRRPMATRIAARIYWDVPGRQVHGGWYRGTALKRSMDARSSRRGATARLTARCLGGRYGAGLAMLAATAVAEPPAPPSPPAFQPGEIVIGEPIALPYGGRPTAIDNQQPATAQSDAPGIAPAVAAPAAATGVPGSGWLGLAVAESTVPGRWRVEEVTAGGPAARAGIAVGDELRAVNGSTLSSAEEVSQSLTALAAGQDVRVAVARGERVTDIVLRAEPRPAARPVEAAEANPRFAAPQAAPRPLPTTTPADDWRAAPPKPADVAQAAVDVQTAPATASVLVPPAATAAPKPPIERRVVAPAPTPPVPGPFVPPGTTQPAARAVAGRPALGVRTVPIDPVLQTRFNLAEPTGAYVVGVVQDLPAGKAGVPPGSVIVALGEQPVRSPTELTKLVSSGPVDRPVNVQFVLPGGEAKRAAVILQPIDASLERVLAGETPDPRPPAADRSAPVARRAERPADDGTVIRQEIRLLRERLERLERALAPASRGGR
jgi:membrane-associated protease RseP (regulator of RpoE activity)